MDAKVLARTQLGSVRLEAVHGDMTAEEVDAIVNAANSQLQHGGGLAGAIVSRGGDSIQDESDRLAPVDVGNAEVTSAGNLPCRWVIHAVGPRWGEGDEEHKLRSAVRTSLEQAQRIGARSVALPAISTGVFGFPKEQGVQTVVDEVRRWVEAHPSCGLEEVHFTAVDEQTATLFAAALRS